MGLEAAGGDEGFGFHHGTGHQETVLPVRSGWGDLDVAVGSELVEVEEAGLEGGSQLADALFIEDLLGGLGTAAVADGQLAGACLAQFAQDFPQGVVVG